MSDHEMIELSRIRLRLREGFFAQRMEGADLLVDRLQQLAEDHEDEDLHAEALRWRLRFDVLRQTRSIAA
jgi:hypothetical protein